MDNRTPFETYLGEISDLISTRLSRLIPEGWDVPDNLVQAMNYSLMAGGKRLRPLLVIAAAESLGASREAAVPVACAIEMIHTYSLVHDDLPAMDNDDYRRGKLTNHKVFGEAMAILAGDGLLTHAFHFAVEAARYGVPAEAVLAIVEDLSRYAGPAGMVGGQAADMEGEQGLTDATHLQYIHEHKTGDLIVFSTKAGGRIGAGDAAQLQSLETYGRAIGLAFQIQDDILDLVGDESKLGKKTQSDVKQGKVTYPYFHGLEESRKEVARLTGIAKEAVTGGNIPDPMRLLQIADYLLQRDH